MATGVLVLGINDGTKLLEKYLKGSKCYKAVGILGSATDTLDSTGLKVCDKEFKHVTYEDISLMLKQHFTGEILQIPPMYSALKLKGERLYDLARKGIEVDRLPRPVTVYSISLDPIEQLLPYFGINVECSGGFYVRSVIADIGVKCNTYAHMVSLERTKQGPFQLDHCLKPEEWKNFDKLCKHIQDMTAMIK